METKTRVQALQRVPGDYTPSEGGTGISTTPSEGVDEQRGNATPSEGVKEWEGAEVATR